MKKLILTVAIYAASMTMFGQAKITYELELQSVLVHFVTTCEDVEFDVWCDLITREQAFDAVQLASRVLAKDINELNEYWKENK